MVGKIQGKKGIERWKGIAWFLVKLNILAIPMWILLYFNITLPALQSFIAYLTFRIVSFLGYNISLSNFSLILVSGLNMLIIAIDTDCTAWKSMYFLAALSIATPAENRSRLKFLAIGLPLIFLINILRIVSTIIIGYEFGFQCLEIVHQVLWREGLIIAVVLIWYFWLRKKSLSRYNSLIS